MSGRTVIVVDDPQQLAKHAADLFLKEAETSVKAGGRFVVAVSGGSTPRAMHRLLSRGPYDKTVPWEHTHLFWVDERLVPYGDDASNFGTARTEWIENIAIPKAQVHPMPVEVQPKDSAELYHKEIEMLFQKLENGYPVFDLIFLGIGSDGHTASLFPGMSLEKTKGKWVLPVKGGEPHVDRLTFTFQLINRARHVVFLVSGAKKAGMVAKLLGRKATKLPAEFIRPAKGKLTWLLDSDAASQLS